MDAANEQIKLIHVNNQLDGFIGLDKAINTVADKKMR